MFRTIGLAVLSASLALGNAVADGVADEADLQFGIGATAYSKGDFTSALEHFLASNRLVPNRNVMFNIARAYEQLQRYPDAYRYYVDAGRGEGGDTKLKADVVDALARVAPKVAVIKVETSPPGATVYVDRKDLGSIGTSPARLGLKAGTYKLVVELAGYEPSITSDLEVGIGQVKEIKVDLVRILGKLEVTGPSGTRMRIDDERGAVACVLPCTLELPPGQHIAYFERSGYAVAPQSFTIAEKQTARIAASATSVVGSLLVSADEANAMIEVDGKVYGFTPAVIPNVPIGKRIVRISLRGYLPIEREIEVRTNTQTDLRDLRLQPERSVSAASRETESIDEAPASVTVITPQELEAFAYPTILEAVRGARGFAVNFDSIYGNAAVRGLGQANDFSNRLLVLSDGAVLNENILYQPFIHYDGRVDLGDVQRIEIVRGPSSVLYGTGAVSGVVNLVMKDREEPDGVHGAISSYDNSTARARVGFTEKRGDLGMWASVAGATSQGRTVTVGGMETANFDAFDAYTATAKAWWKDLTLQTFWTSREIKVPTGNYSSRFGDPRNHGDDQRFLAELKLKTNLDKKTKLLARTHFNYAYYHLDYWYDVETPVPDQPDSTNYFETYKSWWGGAEARVTHELTPKLRVSIGGDATIHTRVNMEGGNFDLAHETIEPGLHVNTPYQVLSASGLVDWRPSKRLRIQGGLRFDYWNLEGNAFAMDEGATTFPAFAPRLAIIARPTDKDIIKLMGGSAFRSPSAYEFFYNDAGVTQVQSTTCGSKLSPENIYSAELEGSHRFNPDWVGLASLHGTLARDFIETVPVGDACAAQSGADAAAIYYRNSNADQRLLGTDLELRRDFRAGMMASLNYGYVNGRYTAAPVADPGASQSRVLPNAPTHYAAAKFIVPIIPSTLSGAVRAAFEDRRRIDTTLNAKTDRAVIADIVLSGVIAKHGLRYAGGVYNLFNWQYALPAAPYAANVMPQNGRTFMLSLTLAR